MKEEKIEKTKDDQLSMTRHYLTSSYNLEHDHPLTIPIVGVEEEVIGTKWVNANLKHAKAFNHYKPLTSGTLDENIEILQSYHEQYNDDKLLRKHDEYDEMNLKHIESSTDDEKTDNEEENNYTERFEKRQRRILQKKSIKKTIVQSIHYDKKWLKLKHCLGFLKAAGYNTLIDEKRKISYEGIHTYCKEHEHEIRVLFDSKKMIWKDILDGNEKKSLSNYVNQKLESMLGIRISPIYHGSTTYEINTLFYSV